MHRLVLFALAVTPGLALAQTLASTGAPPSAAAIAARPESRVASAVRASTTPVLDGRIDENVCTQGQKITQFLEYEPTEGAETRFKTEVCVAYDDKYFYVLARMFDPAPDSIISLLSRRDVRTQSEQLKLVIDSYNDKRTAYQFAVNPAGVKRDFYVYNDNTEDPSWDAVWDVATAIDSLGWVAEFRIPFSQLRFASKPSHTFGLMIVRDVARTNARISWPLYYRSKQGYVSQSGEINGIASIPSPRRLEVAPYVVAKNVTNEAVNDAGQTSYSHPTTGSYGADIKYGLSSNVTLDATLNPDFGQVEADPATLNLTAFETFREEKRPFFLEGTGIFSFRNFCDDIDTGCRGLFYSRRIGRAPTLGGSTGDPSATTIIGAAKITGRLGSGLSMGLLESVTQQEIGSLGTTIEPQTNYAVARLRQDLNNGRSDIGIMATAVNRELDDATRPYLPREAYTFGIDGRHRFWNNNYEVAAMAAGSVVRGDADAIARIQRNGVHFYQRPDDDVQYDPTLERLAGDGQRLSFSKFGGGLTRFQSVLQRYSSGYELNDVGWLQRADEIMFRNWFAFQFNNPNNLWRRAFYNFNYWRYWTAERLPTNEGINTNWHVQLPNQWWVHLGGTLNNFSVTTYDDRASRGGPALRNEPSWNMFTGFEGDSRWRVTPYLFGGTWRNDEGRSEGWWVEPSINFNRISTRFSAGLYVYYEWQDEDNQPWGNYGDAGSDTTHHTFAALDQTWLSVTARLNFTLTPNLSFQFYGQPAISTGTYTNLRELNDPRAENYDDRYKPFLYDCDGNAATSTTACNPQGFDYKEFNTNAVVRWEYRPGSAIFLVWQQGRFQNVNQASEFDGREDFKELFSLHPNNTFLIKASYWFNY
jgi:Domain of unknown function (DUF5916)/Carbohydrate family 9 binding domain-like